MEILFIIQQTLSATLGVNAIIFALAAIGLNMHFGYTGLLNFGQAGFLAIGAYSVAVPVISFGFSLWLALLIGIFNSILFALLLGIPTLRLRADYLAIVTIAAAEIVVEYNINPEAAGKEIAYDIVNGCPQYVNVVLQAVENLGG
jgi:branched-chain amino acid transport system permease protein